MSKKRLMLETKSNYHLIFFANVAKKGYFCNEFGQINALSTYFLEKLNSNVANRQCSLGIHRLR